MDDSDLAKWLSNNPDIEVVGEPIKQTAVNKQWKHEEAMAKEASAKKTLLLQLGDSVPEPVFEHTFLNKYHFDLAWPEYKVYAEIEGGIWEQTKNGYSKGHAHPIRFQSDCKKYSLASVHGWLGVRGSVEQVKTGKVAEWLIMLFKERFDYAEND